MLKQSTHIGKVKGKNISQRKNEIDKICSDFGIPSSNSVKLIIILGRI